LEAAAEAVDRFALCGGVPRDYPRHSCSRHVLGDSFIHLYLNKTTAVTILGILFHDGVTSSSSARKAIKDD